MNTFTIFASAFLVGLTGAMSPGPLLAFAISESVRKGWAAAPLLITGHAALELLTVCMLAAGFGRVLSVAAIGTSVNIVGGSVLIWIGYNTVRDALRGRIDLNVGHRNDRRFHSLGPMISGALISVSNPYWVMWWLTVGSSLIFNSYKSGLPGLSAFFLGHISSDYLWYTLVGIGASSSRVYLGTRAYNTILGACGGIMVVLGATFVALGLFRW